MISAEAGTNTKFNNDFEDYRKVCRERYQQQAAQAKLSEEGKDSNGVKCATENAQSEQVDIAPVDSLKEKLIDTTTSTHSPAPLRKTPAPSINSPVITREAASINSPALPTRESASINSPALPTRETASINSPAPTHNPPPAIGSPALTSSTPGKSKLSSSVDSLKNPAAAQRRNSLTKMFSKLPSVFKKSTGSPSPSPGPTHNNSLRSSKEMAKAAQKAAEHKEEQDWRMARLIAELEMSGKSDAEIQMHLFHIRDQSQYARPQDNSIGGWFRDMNQAFKDEFSTRNTQPVAPPFNPFSGAAPTNYPGPDVAYSYEDLVALEPVPVGLKSTTHLATTVYTPGLALPANQTSCAICMADFEAKENLRSLNCTHHFHTECIDKWLGVATKCPVCKTDVDRE